MNILFVVEKSSTLKILKEFIENNKEIFTENYYFDCIRMVTHLNDRITRIRKRDGVYCIGHKQTDFIPLKLKSIDIPIDTFLEVTTSNCAYQITEHNKMDMIIGICDPDTYGKLAFAKYVEYFNIKNPLFLNIYAFADTHLKTELDINKAFDFNKELEKVKEYLLKNNFSCDYPRKQDIVKLREMTNMNRKEFASYFKFPYRTLENWEFDEALCPPYLYELIEYKLKKEKIIK